MAESISCFHCGEPVVSIDSTLVAKVDGEDKAVCCVGCKAVCEHIYDSGLSVYYQYRTELGSKPENTSLEQFAIYDQLEYLQLISDALPDKQRQITLSLDNIHCAACAWLIENALSKLPGLTSVNVNTINERATLVWRHESTPLSTILSTLHNIGYPSAPFSVSETELKIKQQNTAYIKRLGVAGLFTMQVMMLAIAMYYGAFSKMESHQTSYFKWLSFVLSIPVVFYSALPFLHGAITSLKTRRLTMDVSVAVAIYGAFIVSFYQLLKYGFDGNKGEVYFESISMFTFLLLLGKYLEFKAKTRAILSNANLNKSLPVLVNVIKDNEVTATLVQKVSINDMVLIKPGEQVAIDGVIIEGNTTLNESVVTGEFEPVFRGKDQTVLAGSINIEGTIKVRVNAIGGNTTLSNITRLQEEFTSHKPKLSQFADNISHYFVLGQLVMAVVTYFIWQYVTPEDALWVGLSVLVATCPCALSLATPTAYTCILNRLNKHGILVKNAQAFEQLSGISHAVFDKTGTLTTGRFEIVSEKYYSSTLDTALLKTLIVSLQQQSEHPIARAFTQAYFALPTKPQSVEIEHVQNVIGQGISCIFEGRELKVGSHQFATNTNTHPTAYIETQAHANVFVSFDHTLVAEFVVSDTLRQDVASTITYLKQQNIKPILLTGDPTQNGVLLAEQLGFSECKIGCTPRQKAEMVSALQQQGHRIVMVGDGINDAPVFAAADVSISMSSGADITKYGSDIIILNDKLGALLTLHRAAIETRKTIQTNLNWSLIYNAIILPVAMFGFVPPYVAVIGMSMSSILVVSNSLKLLKG